MLHTDVGLLASGRAATDFSNLLLTADGQAEGFGNSLHLEAATAPLDIERDRRDTADRFVGDWYRTVSAYLLQRHRLGEAVIVVRCWRQTLLGSTLPDRRLMPRDEAFLYAYGCLHQSLIALAVRVIVGDIAPPGNRSQEGAWAGMERSIQPGARPWAFETRVADFSVHLEEAFRAFGGVVEANPRAAEALVRLGHIECMRGSVGSGMRHLRAGADAASDPAVKYFAAVFLGQAHEARGRYQDARAEYERASGLFPSAQSPLLALAALADRVGDRPAADRAAGRLWSLPAAPENRHDPWWDDDGGWRDTEEPLRTLLRSRGGDRGGRQ